MPMMQLYLPHIEARLRGIIALSFCRTIPCNEQEWDKESCLTIATSHNYMNKALHHPDTIKVRLRNQNKRRLPQMLHRSPIVPTGLHYWSTGSGDDIKNEISSSSSLSLVASTARYPRHLQAGFGSICESRDSAISHPRDQDYLSL